MIWTCGHNPTSQNPKKPNSQQPLNIGFTSSSVTITKQSSVVCPPPTPSCFLGLSGLRILMTLILEESSLKVIKAIEGIRMKKTNTIWIRICYCHWKDLSADVSRWIIKCVNTILAMDYSSEHLSCIHICAFNCMYNLE